MLLLTVVGTASAEGLKQRKQSADSARNVMTAPFFRSSAAKRGLRSSMQHGGDTDHLPPTQKNMELVKKFEPTSQGPIEDGQIADLAVYNGYAYLNSWNTPGCGDGNPATPDKGGTYVVDIRNPAQPREVTFLPARPGNYHGEGAHVITIDTPAFKGDVLAVNNEMCRSLSPDEGGGGFDLYNVTDPEHPKRSTRLAARPRRRPATRATAARAS